MAFTAEHLQMADNHIVQAERHVTRQEELVERLRSHGLSTELAEQLLIEFRWSLQQHRDHREIMRRDIVDSA